MASESPVECIADVHAVLGEGPVWVAREAALYWLDIKGRKIFRLGNDGAFTEWPTPMRVGSIAPRKQGGFIAGTEAGLAKIDLDANRFEVFANPEKELPTNRFNDGKVDRQGRFWAGTMDDQEKQASGTLYRIGSELAVSAADRGYKVTNGPAFSPDGMTVDSEACLWIAFWDGWCVRRYSPQGEWLETVKVPVARPTSCSFGGADLDRLYITSASIGLDEQAREMQPNAGGLFMLIPGVRGLADVPFAG